MSLSSSCGRDRPRRLSSCRPGHKGWPGREKARMARRFSAQRGATRVVFGAGSAAGMLAEVEALGAQRVLVVCTPGRRAEGAALAQRLGSRGAGALATAREHVPIDVVASARAEVER